ncbi:RUS1 family protein C16orf58 homolog [Copidosoma floridanum]|uniref:RUS1 family protein C16orf58 homolog n=1 Tax=Copidosoma floridanum TaxID=29053 RepID=UPI0006C98EF6|nr:RUS1 family protein C16orf58 homolog [Copidosoma floridanum]
MSNREIELSESDGYHRNKIHFHKSTDEPYIKNFKPIRGGKFADSFTYSFFKEVFLPQGFPDSVHKDYVSYQIWDTLQAFASTINGTLTTHSIMKGVGVGESTATPLAAAITWILKDGTGMVGRILFAWWQGNNLGSQCKKWRLFADILNDFAMTLEITVPYVPVLSSYTLCLTTGMKSIVGIAGGATRTSIMQHHAIKDNLADISAKEHSQGTLVNLAGSIVGIFILLCIHERLFLYLCFLLVIVHIVSNYFAVTSLQINTLNEDRLCLIIEDYILNHTVSNVATINDRESVFLLWNSPAKKRFGFDIEIGVSIEYILKTNLVRSKDLPLLIELLQRRKYLPIMDVQQRKIHIVLPEEIDDAQILKAYFYSCIYAVVASSMMDLKSDVLFQKNCPSHLLMKVLLFSKKCKATLSKSDKQVSAELISTVDEMVHEDCDLFIKLLDESEWVSKANMLLAKSWRCSWKS